MSLIIPSIRKGLQIHAQRFSSTILNQKTRMVSSQCNNCNNICQNSCNKKNKSRLHSLAHSPLPIEDVSELQNAKIESANILSLEYKNGVKSEVPHVWLRDNCQCSECFDHGALARKSLLQNLDIDVAPRDVEIDESGKLLIEWNDGHKSVFNSPWMYKRRFDDETARSYDTFVNMKKVTWSSDHTIKEFAYSELIENKVSLFDFLATMEIRGVAKITACPHSKTAATELCNFISMVRRVHYGMNTTVAFRPNANNLAAHCVELGLHADLTYYDHQPGLILLHMVEQAKDGGYSIVSDGFHAADIIRRTNSAAFDLLSTLPVYFWDKGHGINPGENEEFYKITKLPQILLDRNGELSRISINNGVRDSYLDLPVDKIKPLYEAMKLYNAELYKNSIKLRMNSGEIMVLDNVRCLHGRGAFQSTESRFMETCYIDWDEAKCCRRRLQEKIDKFDLHRIVI